MNRRMESHRDRYFERENEPLKRTISMKQFLFCECVMQCDQMVIQLIQYLAIYNNEHLLNTIKVAKVGSTF